ncbi:MAG: polysaccharide deacetylase family protein [Planctomycetes bacterium]|nr:polysaccharide deacetylase family protein [Planctomycetota bacterium]
MRGILTYHSVDPSGSAISISEHELRQHIRFFASRRVQIVPLEWLHKVPADRDALAITFDDGFQNFADVAWPLFKHNDLPVTLFVPTERLGGRNDWGGTKHKGIPELPLMSWETVAKLVEHGLTLGSHSRTHPHLETLDDAGIERELAGSADDIEKRTGARPKAFCYPFGTFDERCVAVARKHYEVAVTTELAALPDAAGAPDLHRLPRLDAYYWRGDGLERWGTGSFRRRIAFRALARRVRATFGG